MTNIDKPKTGGKESVTYFGNMFSYLSNWWITGSLWKGSDSLWKYCKDVNGFRIKFQGN